MRILPHTLKFDVSYSYDNAFYTKGDVYNLDNISELSQFTINEPQKKYQLGDKSVFLQ